MLVLNRRPGESIVIEHGVQVSVLSVTDRKVWLSIEAPGVDPPVRVSATALSDTEARIEIGAPVSLSLEDGAVRVDVARPGHLAARAQATIGLNRRVGESVHVGDSLTVGLGSLAKGNPTLSIEGPSIADGLRITLIRPVGNYVRIGVEAPDRRVYRKELWDDVLASNRAAAVDGELAALLDGAARPGSDGERPSTV